MKIVYPNFLQIIWNSNIHSNFLDVNSFMLIFIPAIMGATFPNGSKSSATLPTPSRWVKFSGILPPMLNDDFLPLFWRNLSHGYSMLYSLLWRTTSSRCVCLCIACVCLCIPSVCVFASQVCVCLCVPSVCMCVCVLACQVCVCVCVCVCMCMCVCVCACQVCVRVCVPSVCVCVCLLAMCVCVRLCATCVCVCMPCVCCAMCVQFSKSENEEN